MGPTEGRSGAWDGQGTSYWELAPRRLCPHAERGGGEKQGQTGPGRLCIHRPLAFLPSLAPSLFLLSFLTYLCSPFLSSTPSLPPSLVYVQNTLLPPLYLTCG